MASWTDGVDVVRVTGPTGRAVPLVRLWRDAGDVPLLVRTQAVAVLCVAGDAVSRVGNTLRSLLAEEAADSDAAEWTPGAGEQARQLPPRCRCAHCAGKGHHR